MKKTIVGLIILAAALTTTAALYTHSLKPIKTTTNNTKIAITASTQNTADNINTSTDKKTATSVESEKTTTKPKVSTDSTNNNVVNNSTLNNTQNSSNSSSVVSAPSTPSNVTITNNSQPTVNKNNISTNTTSNISTNKSDLSNSKKSDEAPSITTNKTANSTLTNTTSKTSSNTKSVSNTKNNTPPASSSLEESEATFDNNNSSSPATFSALQAQNKKYAPANTAIVTNLNDYKIVNGKKYYNIYEYKIGDSSSDWVFDGNHSNFLGAKYMDVNGDVLNNQYIQDFSSLTTNEKATQIENVANQFVGYFNYNGPVKVNMHKQINFHGYTCYLVTFGAKSFYMNPAGFIYIDKSQSFY